jgi:NADPH2:quinone reductase
MLRILAGLHNENSNNMKTHAIRIHQFGGPDVLRFEEVDLPEPAAGEARIRHKAIGLNFIDTYFRTGLYPSALPAGLGSEAAGIVEAVGPGVKVVKVGDRVAYTGRPADAFSEARNFPANQLVPIPPKISDEQAAAVLLKGMTAWYLLRRSYPVKKGDAVLLYAAAGGVVRRQPVGQVTGDHRCRQHAKRRSSRGQTARCRWPTTRFPAPRKLTGGEGVAAVYDSVGKDTFLHP